MNDEQLLRYSRQILLPGFGIEGQQALLNSRVLMVGMGGLGCPAALYLAAAGVGELILVDADRIELSNLQRQVLYHEQDIGEYKVEAAKKSLLLTNPGIKIKTISQRLEAHNVDELLAGVDVVLDGTDNFASRFLINQACVKAAIPLVSAAVIQFEGQVSSFNNQGDGPCYHCLYADGEEPEQGCNETGVLAPVAGLVACVQATEAIKLLTGIGKPLLGRLLLLDATTMQWREMRLLRDPACGVCS